MKKISILLFVLSLSISTYSQKVDSLEFNVNGLNGFLVKEMPNTSASEIYIKAKKWAEYNIRNAESAITSDIENEYIAFNIRHIDKIYSHRALGKDYYPWWLNLYCEIRIKDGKLRLDIKEYDFECVSSEACQPLLIKGGSMSMSFYNKKGKERTHKTYKTVKLRLEKQLNDFCFSLFNSLKNKQDYKKEDW